MDSLGLILIMVGGIALTLLSIYIFYLFLKLVAPHHYRTLFWLVVISYALIFTGSFITGKYAKQIQDYNIEEWFSISMPENTKADKKAE